MGRKSQLFSFQCFQTIIIMGDIYNICKRNLNGEYCLETVLKYNVSENSKKRPRRLPDNAYAYFF